MPLDPGRHWLAAGITGLARQREWDVVVTTDAPGHEGDELEFVTLPGGRLLVTGERTGFDATPFAAALEAALDPPYRAVAVRRPELWAVGARSLDVARLDPDPPGSVLELTWDGAALALVADGMPADPATAAALEQLARERERGPYAAHAQRLTDDLWEVQILPL